MIDERGDMELTSIVYEDSDITDTFLHNTTPNIPSHNW